jgi:hypothetical protein
MPDYFPENNTALWSDTEVRSLQIYLLRWTGKK